MTFSYSIKRNEIKQYKGFVARKCEKLFSQYQQIKEIVIFERGTRGKLKDYGLNEGEIAYIKSSGGKYGKSSEIRFRV